MPDGVYQRTSGAVVDYIFIGEGLYVEHFPTTLVSMSKYIKSQADRGRAGYLWDTQNCVIKMFPAVIKRVDLRVVPNMSMERFDMAFGVRNDPNYRESDLTISDYRKVYRLLMEYAPPELQERVRAKYDETGLLRPGHSLQEQ